MLTVRTLEVRDPESIITVRPVDPQQVEEKNGLGFERWQKLASKFQRNPVAATVEGLAGGSNSGAVSRYLE